MQGNEEKRIFCGTRHCHDTCRLCRKGMFRYVCTDENGCEHIVGYAFAGEYVGDYPQCIKKDKAMVSIQATTDSLIYYASAQEIINFFSTDKSTQELEKI